VFKKITIEFYEKILLKIFRCQSWELKSENFRSKRESQSRQNSNMELESLNFKAESTDGLYPSRMNLMFF